MTHEDFMRVALSEAKKGDRPFGAVLVKDDQIMMSAHNTAKTDSDPSAHAEINVLRKLLKQKQNYTLDALKGYSLYTTCEPCPMCAAACVWAGVSEIIFGASIEQLTKIGVKQINISCQTVVAQGFQEIKITTGVLATEAIALFETP